MEQIHKTFSDILEDAVVEKFNPNHDKLGRFTTSGGGGVVTNNTSSANTNGGFKKVGERTENGKTISYGESDVTRKIKADISSSSNDPKTPSKIDTIYETRDENGETLSWEIGVKGNKNHKIIIEDASSGEDPQETIEDFYYAIEDARDMLSCDIKAMEECDYEHFGMGKSDFWTDEISWRSDRTDSEEYLDHPLEFEITRAPKYYPATWDSPEEYEEGEIDASDGSDPYGLMEALDEIYRSR